MLKELGVSRIQSQALTSHRTGCLAAANDEMSTSTESDSLASLFSPRSQVAPSTGTAAWKPSMT